MKNIDIINKIIKTLSNRNGFDNWWDDIDDDIKDDIKNDLVSILDDALLDKPENIVFNDDEISEFQKMETFHPLTCGGPSDIPECKRNKKEGDTYEEREGILIPTKDGLICPCGKYTQNYVHNFIKKLK